MAKKSRKARTTTKINAAPQHTESQQPQAPVQVQGQAASRKSRQQPVVAAVNILQPGHYDYVKEDLIRIAIISAVLILILIVLTFIPALKT
jgi:hypothetical protein